MTTLPNTGMTLPTRGSAGAGLWGDTMDANLAIIDAMDHTPGHGPRIPTAGISINADLPFSALWAPTQLHRVQFSAIAGATLTGAQRKSLFVSDGTGGLVANELYWLTTSGASVQLTAGSTLNVGAFVAGIGGDYAGVGAQLNYTDSSKTYDFKESTADSHAWGRVQCGGIRLIEFGTTETFFVAHIAPAALGASYTVTWPTALPGSQLLEQVDNTGQVIWSNTVPGAVTFSAGITLGANQSVNLSGTGVVKHGTYTLQIPGSAFVASATDATAALDFSNGASTGAPLNVLAPILLKQGARILAIRCYIIDGAGGPTKIQATFLTISSTGIGTAVLSSVVSAGSGASQTLSITPLTTVVSALTGYAIKVVTTTGTSLCKVWMAEVDYDTP